MFLLVRCVCHSDPYCLKLRLLSPTQIFGAAGRLNPELIQYLIGKCVCFLFFIRFPLEFLPVLGTVM